MTTPVSGSSLPQARDVHQHNHFHNSADSHHKRLHTHHNHHARSHHDHDHDRDHGHGHSHSHDHARSSRKGHRRNGSEPTVIVQTVSVLQIIDGTGATLTLQTLTPSNPTSAPPAITSDATGDPGSESVSDQSASTYPGTSDDEGDGLQSSSTSLLDPTVTPSESSMPTSFPTLSYSPLTSTPLSGSPAFPSLPGVTNSTQVPSSSIFPNSTSSQQPFSVESFNGSSSTVSASASGSFYSSSSGAATSTLSFKSASTSFASFETPSATSNGDGAFGGGNGQPSASSTAAAGGDDAGSSDGPGAATVAGSVIGGVAALAFLLILALGLLRWRRRHNTLKLMRGSTNERGPGGVLVGNSGPIGGGGAGGDGAAMSERRRSIPFAIPAALASLTGHKRASGRSAAASSDGGERGFSKISGRKLPPVLQFGGDGYSDPRDTMQSDQSIEYRDSQAFPGLMAAGGPTPTRLALGVPMRPDSGVPVFNAGPARTPVQEQGPFSPYTDTSPLEPPSRDPLGRSHPSHDGSSRSHGSPSRFTEVL
ncbi:hypothetical protein GGR52DRAFT_79339 [Hypoxylon sp. FL1284]|nr:hypothetical protein GGR52DRAFT_79339 [Hypoxylon sp. FL1284]